MRPMGCVWALLIVVVAAALGVTPTLAEDSGFADDFESGLGAWEMTDANAWEAVEEPDGNHAMGLVRASDYSPPVRSPLNMARVKGRTFKNFEMTVRLKQTGREYGHRDLCLFFGYVDPSHFYYVHLASKADEHANSIFLVDGAPRRTIADKRTDGTKWDDAYHTVKVVRDVESGRIEVYFDDMSSPVMTATDKSFGAGQVGLGSFDDVGHFDDFRVVETAK